MPAFCPAAHRRIVERGGVISAVLPIDFAALLTSDLVGVEDLVLGAGSSVEQVLAGGTTTAVLVLSGSVVFEGLPRGPHVIGPHASLVGAVTDPTCVTVSNPGATTARLIRVLLAGADHNQAVLGPARDVVVGAAAIRLTDRFMSADRPGLAYVCEGSFSHEAVDPLEAGDWVVVDGTNVDLAVIEGHGRLLVVELGRSERV